MIASPAVASQYSCPYTSPSTSRRCGSGRPGMAASGRRRAARTSGSARKSTLREDAWPSRRPRASSSVASARPREPVAWINRPRPITVWLQAVAARRKLTESSAVATPIPGGALVSTEEPRAISATKAVVPARKTPAADCHQPLAGIQALAIARPASDRRRPVSLVTGGSGSRRSRHARSRSSPDSCNTSAPHVLPLRRLPHRERNHA